MSRRSIIKGNNNVITTNKGNNVVVVIISSSNVGVERGGDEGLYGVEEVAIVKTEHYQR